MAVEFSALSAICVLPCIVLLEGVVVEGKAWCPVYRIQNHALTTLFSPVDRVHRFLSQWHEDEGGS